MQQSRQQIDTVLTEDTARLVFTAELGVLTEDWAGLGVLTDDLAGLGVLTEDGAGLGVLTAGGAGLGVLTEDGAGLGALTEAIEAVITVDKAGLTQGLGEGEGLEVFLATKFGFREADCDPPNRDLVKLLQQANFGGAG